MPAAPTRVTVSERMAADVFTAAAGAFFGASAAAAVLWAARRTAPEQRVFSGHPSPSRAEPLPLPFLHPSRLFHPVLLCSTAAAFSAVFWVWIEAAYGRGGTAAAYSLLASGLLAASAADGAVRLIPNSFLAGMFAAVTVPLAFGPPGWLGRAAAGAALCGAGMVALYALARGRLGGGDVKLAIINGWVLGPGPGVLGLTLGLIFGALGAGAVLLFAGGGRRTEFPYGPFLAAGALAAMLWGPAFMPHLF